MQMFLLRPLREGARDEGLLLVLDPGSLCEAESGKKSVAPGLCSSAPFFTLLLELARE